jgi:hypothetical protein
MRDDETMQSSLTERLAHLRRRTGFSARASEIEPLIALGIEGAVDKLLESPYDHSIDDEAVLRILQGEQNNLQPQAVSAWWLYRMLVSQQPIQERLALFWHNHFATSAAKVQAGRLMLIQIQLFQRLGLDNFKTLTLEVAKDPAMLVWLDGVRNVKGKPNENFARELFELFTTGIGHYTERDIQEAARAFTGWSFSRVTSSFVFNRNQHDTDEKEVFGKRGAFTGEDIIEMAVEHPATAPHIARKFYQHFINDTTPPDERTVQDLAKAFRESGYSIRALMRRLLLTPAFWSHLNWRKRVKSPVEFVVGALRQVGVGERLRGVNLSDGAGAATAGGVPALGDPVDAAHWADAALPARCRRLGVGQGVDYLHYDVGADALCGVSAAAAGRAGLCDAERAGRTACPAHAGRVRPATGADSGCRAAAQNPREPDRVPAKAWGRKRPAPTRPPNRARRVANRLQRA